MAAQQAVVEEAEQSEDAEPVSEEIDEDETIEELMEDAGEESENENADFLAEDGAVNEDRTEEIEEVKPPIAIVELPAVEKPEQIIPVDSTEKQDLENRIRGPEY